MGAVFEDAHGAGGDAFYRSVLVVQHLGAGEPGIDLDAERLGLLTQPFGDVA